MAKSSNYEQISLKPETFRQFRIKKAVLGFKFDDAFVKFLLGKIGGTQ